VERERNHEGWTMSTFSGLEKEQIVAHYPTTTFGAPGWS
jgi:hypothetical protein